jgi:hypothetical protein
MKNLLKALVCCAVIAGAVGCARLSITSPNGTKVAVVTFLDSQDSLAKLVVRSNNTVYVGGLDQSASSTGVVAIINASSALLGTAAALAAKGVVAP